MINVDVINHFKCLFFILFHGKQYCKNIDIPKKENKRTHQQISKCWHSKVQKPILCVFVFFLIHKISAVTPCRLLPFRRLDMDQHVFWLTCVQHNVHFLRRFSLSLCLWIYPLVLRGEVLSTDRQCHKVSTQRVVPLNQLVCEWSINNSHNFDAHMEQFSWKKTTQYNQLRSP